MRQDDRGLQGALARLGGKILRLACSQTNCVPTLSRLFTLYLPEGMYRMTLTIDLIDSGALKLLRDMEHLNLIRVNPPVDDNTGIVTGEKKTPFGHSMAKKKDIQRSTPLSDRLLGIASHAGDISLDELRAERLNKYLK
jgi:hypothetical protein